MAVGTPHVACRTKIFHKGIFYHCLGITREKDSLPLTGHP